MKIRSLAFELSAVRPAQWPADGLPEFAFVGRSNVGKSSLLNRLLGRRHLARVSSKPGKTQQINFYRVNERFRFADLPGYGYAAVGKGERAAFQRMIHTYLQQRDPLVRVLHLVDIRHHPSRDDLAMHRWLLDLGVPVLIVATKADKVKRSEWVQAPTRIRRELDSPWDVLSVSAEKNMGIDALWAILEDDLGVTDRPSTNSSDE
ncbi:ribosome biogenesis GTP-binding protein YihA/YsxC [Alicyclobacillus shizuokensis]|uniref:ribosome biogenesis GTP-binding protein YihA/YsxC n=1 Tax=Alicyclobacillus shizuokensis TaxID=392014 RepID=UPI00082E04F3|nr:ribosome biogenesis GTP-binding protein YihA/YsxC [Alicyclobacillus shizuokensis]MCL6626388.1 ribosome biogenesis GTP-binding protein YihA/YsxC [Alicyclobacillus shizuokensis]